ncbi:hypothetical protein GGR54DRAFT_639328 [Hypoxylon sp. NC1633]|nr:hypothetical protein GGR54DRAFT_639328 [Hypoxylon sp. NC1633]
MVRLISIVVHILGMTLPFVSCKIWVQFCDDTGCSENCGISVSINDPGCLANEGGRRSLKLHGSDFIGAYLVHSPDARCGCQNDCTDLPGAGAPTCLDLSGKAPSQSYRFQLTTCKTIEAGSDSGIGNNCDKPPPNQALIGSATTINLTSRNQTFI